MTIVRQKGFREFSEAMDPQYVLPSHRSLTTKFIPELDMEVMSRIRQDLKQVNYVALTSDGWSSRVSTTCSEQIFQINYSLKFIGVRMYVIVLP